MGTPFDGKIDDVRLYDRALSETEIQALYSDGINWTKDGNNPVLVPGNGGIWDQSQTRQKYNLLNCKFITTQQKK